LSPDSDEEFREIRSILREAVTAINENSKQISALTADSSKGREAAVAQVKEAVEATAQRAALSNQKMIWFLVGAVILASLGTKGLEILAKLFGVG
jgi:hypothetical protein